MNVSTSRCCTELVQLLRDFQTEYHDANRKAVSEMGWEHTWSAVAKACADQMASGQTDAFEVRRKLEALVDIYRRITCNPVQLFASVHVQDAVAQHVAALEQWYQDAALVVPTPAGGPHTAWQTMRRNAGHFIDWTPGATSFNLTRVPWNPYTNPRLPEPLCAAARRTLLFCALAETVRLMAPSPSPPADVVATADEWQAYRAEVWEWADGRLWWTLDDVAVHHLGMDLRAASMGEGAVAREPLLRADRALRRLVLTLSHDQQSVIRRWLCDVCKMCADTYLGVRFPPSFVALLCDLIAEAVGPGDGTDIEPCTTTHPLQVYPVWVRFGILCEPTLEQITQGWEVQERAVLAQHGDRFTSDVFLFWDANRRLTAGGSLVDKA